MLHLEGGKKEGRKGRREEKRKREVRIHQSQRPQSEVVVEDTALEGRQKTVVDCPPAHNLTPINPHPN